jgi:hypothetical protein
VFHALTVGALTGGAFWVESPAAHGVGWRALLVGAAVAGLSGGAGAVIRSRQASPWPAEDMGELVAKLAELDAKVLRLTNLVTTLLAESQLPKAGGE